MMLGLKINTSKTETMSIRIQHDFFIDGTKLTRVANFKYLGCLVTKDCMMDDVRIQSATCAFVQLKKKVFDCRDLNVETKSKSVINVSHLSLCMAVYHKHVKQLRTIQQRHLKSIMNIKWAHFVTNDEVLERAGVEDIAIKLIRTHLCWMGHVARMNDERPVKALLYGGLAEGSRKIG